MKDPDQKKVRRVSIEEKLPKYYKICSQIWEDPFMPYYQIRKNTGISKSSISRYLLEMYQLSILKRPTIFLNPAQNYHEYAAFLKFQNPQSVYKLLANFPYVISRSLGSGRWNLLLICGKMMDFSLLKGFRQCILQKEKGRTFLSKVTSLDWDESMKKIDSLISPPKEKSFLYEEIPSIPWGRREWALYHIFKNDIRMKTTPTLKKHNIRYEWYQKWTSQLKEFASIQTAFYPQGLDNYLVFDFLFRSEYQKQLTDILGLLPSTSVFIPMDEYLLARLSILNRKEKNDLFSLVFRLGEEGFFTDFSQAVIVSTSHWGFLSY